MDSESRVEINSKFLNKFIRKNVKRYLTFLIQQYFSVVESLKVIIYYKCAVLHFNMVYIQPGKTRVFNALALSH